MEKTKKIFGDISQVLSGFARVFEKVVYGRGRGGRVLVYEPSETPKNTQQKIYEGEGWGWCVFVS